MSVHYEVWLINTGIGLPNRRSTDLPDDYQTEDAAWAAIDAAPKGLRYTVYEASVTRSEKQRIPPELQRIADALNQADDECEPGLFPFRNQTFMTVKHQIRFSPNGWVVVNR